MSIALQIRADAQQLVSTIEQVASVCDEDTLVDLGLVIYDTVKALRKAAVPIRERLTEGFSSLSQEKIGSFAKAILKPSAAKVRDVRDLASALERGSISPQDFFEHFVIRAIDLKHSNLQDMPEALALKYVDSQTPKRVQFDER